MSVPSEALPSESPAPRRGADAALALGLALGALATYSALFQRRLFGDASLIFQGYQSGAPSDHRGHELVAHALRGAGLEWLAALRWATVLPACLAPPLLYVALRRFDFARAAALAATLLTSLAGSALFWSTSMEKYGLLWGCACAAFCVVSFAPRNSLAGGLVAVVVASGLLVFGHQTAFSAAPAVGLVVLWQLLRGEQPRRRVLSAAAAAAAVGLVAGVFVVVRHFQHKNVGPLTEFDWLGFLNHDKLTPSTWVEKIRVSLLQPLALLGPLALGGLFVGAASKRAPALLAVAWIVPNVLILSMIAPRNLGSYYLTGLPGFAWLVVLLIQGATDRFGALRVAPFVAVALVFQGVRGVEFVRDYDRELAPDERALVDGLVEVTGGLGTYLAPNDEVYELAHSYTTLVTHRPLQARVFGEEQVDYVLETFVTWAEEADRRGRPLYVHPGLVELARTDELAARAVEFVERRFELEQVEAGEFRVLRGVRRP